MSEQITSIEQSTGRRRRWPWLVGGAAALAAIIVGGWALVPSAESAGETGGEPNSGGTLEFGMIDYQRSPDPQWGTNYAESIIGNNVTDKLTWQDPKTGEITPWLAESWEYNDDLTEFTFHLRRDVTFSDGEKFDAEAVKENFDQYVHGDDKLGILPNGAQLLRGYVETETPDEYTAVVRFDEPAASFLQSSSFTANAQPGFLSPNTLKKSAEERSDPKNVIGTGPFVYDSWEEQVQTTLVRRDDYDWSPPSIGHDGPALLDKIVFNVVPESSVRTGSLTSGSLDAILDVGTTDEEPLKEQGYSIISREVSGTAIRFQFNTSLFPTNDIAVRKAIQRGWDREAIEKTVLTDSYSTATSILTPSVQGYTDLSGSALSYEPDEAERILDEAGWKPGKDGIREKDGKRLEVDLIGINNLVANQPAYESIQQDLSKIGIDLNLEVLPIPDYTAALAHADEDYNLVAANRSRNDPAVLNLSFNPEIGDENYFPEDFDGLDEITEALEDLETTLDPDTRQKYAAEAQRLVVDKYALTNPVYNPSQVIAHDKSVHGIIFDAQSRNHFVNTWLEDA